MILDILPIDSHLRSILSALREHSGIVVTAPPGAGKTTRIPRAIYQSGLAGDGEILVLQPRRLATRLAAARVAAELGEEPGETVGFAVRYESVGGAATRIRFVTEAILSRRIVQDPALRGVSVVLLDEFHERHIAADLGLALLRRLQKTHRPDLKVIVLSATLEPAPVAAFLGGVPVVSCPETRFPLSIEFEPRIDERPLEEKVRSAVGKLLSQGMEGDILVFLPGAAEIRRSAQELQSSAAQWNLVVLPLHGDLPAAQQSAAIEPNTRRKIILATNVAETSVTIPGVAAVVDSGLARVAVHSPWTGIPALKVARISRSSAIQRAGRAGRTREGRAIRLYTVHDFETRPEQDLPEIKRADLAEMLLTLHGAGLPDPTDFNWFESPPQAALEAAESLLRALSALDREGRLTDIGRSLLRFPVHPRLARLVVEGEKLGAARDAACLAALLSERNIRLESRVDMRSDSRRIRTVPLSSSDALDLLANFQEAEEARFHSHRLGSLGLDPSAVERVRRALRQLENLTVRSKHRPAAGESKPEALQIALLTAFPDRVVKRRGAGSRDLLLSQGGEARLSESSSVHNAPLMIAIDVEERAGRGRKGETVSLVRLASEIEPEWLAALFPDDLLRESKLFWNERAARVDEAWRTCYGQVVLEESVRPAAPSEEASSLLTEAVMSAGLSCFRDLASVGELRVRLGLLAENYPDEKVPETSESALVAMVRAMCRGKRSLAEVSSLSLVEHCLESITPRQKGLLQRELPDRIPLGSRRNLKVHYEEKQPPWVESRLQDFFHVRSTPAICGGRVRLTVRLLAPNGRPVQITQDLEGFWKRHYPAIRRELQRRYPKHAWPAPDEL